MRVAHAPGMPGTFSPSPRVSDPNMHHGTCVTHMPWCMPGSLTSSAFEVDGGEDVPGIPGACTTQIFTYLVRGPWKPLDSPGCKYMENMWDFTRTDASEKSRMQTILFQFKRDEHIWKRLICPQRLQGTWRQTAVTPYTGLRVVYSYILIIIYIIMSSVYLSCAPSRCSLTEHQCKYWYGCFIFYQITLISYGGL